LQVLARLLGGGETSRLWRVLVADSRLALSAWASYSATSLGLSSFDLGVDPAPQAPMVEIESAVGSQLGRLIDDGVTADEVERAQNQLLASAIYARDSLASGPRSYGAMLSVGGSVADIDAWPQRIAAVTPTDVIAAARNIWRPERLVTSMLTPQVGSR
jgi:zinc protease